MPDPLERVIIMNSKTIINLPDMIRGARNPYMGTIANWCDDRDEQRLVSYIENDLGLEIGEDADLDSLLAMIPDERAEEAISDMYDDPNAKIIVLMN